MKIEKSKSIINSIKNANHKFYLYDYQTHKLLCVFNNYEELKSYFSNKVINKKCAKPSIPNITEKMVFLAINCEAGYGRFLTNYYLSKSEDIKFLTIEEEIDRFNEWLRFNISNLKNKLSAHLNNTKKLHNYDEDRIYEVLAFMTRQIQSGSVINNYEATFFSKYSLQVSYDNDPRRPSFKRNNFYKNESYYKSKYGYSYDYEFDLNNIIEYKQTLNLLTDLNNNIEDNKVKKNKKVDKKQMERDEIGIEDIDFLLNSNEISDEEYEKLMEIRSTLI